MVNEEGEPEPNLDVYIWYSAPTPKQPDLYDLFTAGLTDQQGLTRQFSDVPVTNLILEVYNHSINSGSDEESAEEYPFTGRNTGPERQGHAGLAQAKLPGGLGGKRDQDCLPRGGSGWQSGSECQR